MVSSAQVVRCGLVLITLLSLEYDVIGTFDFEVGTDKDSFVATGSTKQDSVAYAKNGTKSLKWDWPIASSAGTFKLKMTVNKGISPDVRKAGGLKFWMYRPSSLPDATVNIYIYTDVTPTGSKPTQNATVHLNFEGWRAAWISYKEFKIHNTATRITHVDFEVHQPTGTAGRNEVYLDLVGLVDKVARQTRDQVVPYLPGTTHHDSRSSYQRTYYWSNKTVPTPGSYTDITGHINNITEVERRLESWYADTTNSSYDSLANTNLNTYRQSKWASLQSSINSAHKLYETLTTGLTATAAIKKPPLFSKVSEYGKSNITGTYVTTKFNYITEKILQPIAIDFILKSRARQITRTLDVETPKLATERRKVVKRVAGTSTEMMALIPTTVTTRAQLNTAITNLNTERKDRIIRLLKYLYDQGFAEGSGLGSLDHEWNMNAAGFMHGVYAVRNNMTTTFRNKMIKAAKWFNDFNEAYSDNYTNKFEFDGTTSDQMKTMMLYRIMTVLIMPDGTTLEKKEKIRDMFAVRNNAENSMKINLGLGGVFKPDGTSFHHQTFYGPAYAPYAVHTAAIVNFILEGTKYKLRGDAFDNLKHSLEVLRIVAVKYSTPNSLSGRFPNYKKQILARILPAYAYYCYKHGATPSGDTVNGSSMFLRLYDPTEPAIEEELEVGGLKGGAYYLNTIGSLDIMQWVLTKSTETAEASPSGHWSFGFAALSIQRRHDWAVAARGFSNYVWDYESGNKENIYGIFGSYGTLQISNSEAALASYDVKNGWDWTRVPGATTVNLDLEDLRTKKMRFYNPEALTGGVNMCGSAGSASTTTNCSPQNGLFTMDYSKPSYDAKVATSPLQTMTFKFKKSFFFMENLIVCVVSNVQFSAGTTSHYVQTTLFQDKKLRPDSEIEIDGTSHNVSVDLAETSHDASVKNNLLLKDTNDNIYRVVKVRDSGLHVKISLQNSKDHKTGTATTGRYATAWLEHKSAVNYIRYDVLIDGGPLLKRNFSQAHLRQKDSTAHVFEFLNEQTRNTTFGYSIFAKDTTINFGPISEASRPCTVMTEEGTKFLFVSLSNPAFTLVKDGRKRNKVPCKGSSASTYDKPVPDQSEVTKELLYCSKSNSTAVVVTLSSTHRLKVDAIVKVWVNKVDIPSADRANYAELRPATNPTKIRFKRLQNGFTTEVKISLK